MSGSHPTYAGARAWAGEYLLPLAVFLGLALLLLWPLPLFFTRAMIGTGDVNWGVGSLWYWKEALLGQEPPYYATRLYYPQGISFITNAAGPFSALLALPFWGLGPAGAYNAAVVLGFGLSGCCMYWLAREIGASRPAAWLAGLIFLLAPLHVYGALSHINKVFIGLIPLALLVTQRALARPRWRPAAILTGPLLVLAFLQAPEQLLFAGLGCAVLVLYALITAPAGERRAIFRRAAVVTISIAVCVLPLVWLVAGPGARSGVSAGTAQQSAQYQPDLLQFIVPPDLGLLPHAQFLRAWLTPAIPYPLETAVYLSWAGLLLGALAWWKNRRAAAPWLLILGVAMLLALGPTLRAGGDSALTRLELPLPYGWLNTLPGLSTMRTPGRFMLLGAAALAAVAALGADQLRRQLRPPLAAAVLALLGVYVLLDTALLGYPSQPLPPPLPFYQQIASDPERYGVFDLPIRPSTEDNFWAWHIYFSSFYQLDQVTHGKGIATGYVSRHYAFHPLFAHFISQNFDTVSPLQEDVTVDGQPSSRYANLRYDLAQNNYRYVVFHKPGAGNPPYTPGSFGEQSARALLQEVFGDEPPLVDDALSTVYAVGPAPEARTLAPSIALLEPAAEMRWEKHRSPQSPAAFLVHAPQPILTHLDVRLADVPGAPPYLALAAESGDGNVLAQTPLVVGETARVPVALAPGRQIITLTVSTPDGDESPPEPLAFAIGQIDLSTQPDTSAPLPVAVGGVQASYGSGWYGDEGAAGGLGSWRWAASPAEFWVYSSAAQTVTLAATPVALHDPASPDGKGAQGSLAATVNGVNAGKWPVVTGAPFAAPLSLQEGWNTVTLALAAGNFRPVDLQPATGDARVLSFALGDVAIRP